MSDSADVAVAEANDEKLQEEAYELQEEGLHKEALMRFISLSPEAGATPANLFRRGVSAAVEGQIGDALELWDRLGPDGCEAQATLHMELLDQAFEKLNERMESDKNSFLPCWQTYLACKQFDRSEDALKAIKLALDRDPSQEEASAAYVELLGEDNLHEALEFWEEVLEKNPVEANGNYWTGEIYRRLHKAALAIRHLKRAIETNARDWRAHYSLGQIYLDQHRHQEAEEEFGKACDAKPGEFELVLARARVCKELYQFDDALTHLSTAMGLDPDNRELKIEHARLAVQMGAYEQATTGLEMALEDSPEEEDLKAALGRSYALTGEPEKAKEILAPLAEGSEDPDLHFYLGKAVMEGGDLEGAVPHLEKAVKLRPEQGAYLGLLARLLHNLGRTDEALNMLRAAAKADPNNIDTQLALAAAAQKAGETAEAYEAMAVSARLEPERVDVHLTLGRLAMVENKHDEAATAFKEVLKLESEPNSSALQGLAQIYHHKGMMEISMDFHKQALEADPTLRTSAHALAAFYLDNDDRDTLVQVFNETLSSNREELQKAGTLVGSWKSFLEPKREYEVCLAMLGGLLDAFPGHPEILREQARLFVSWANIEHQKGGPAAAVAVLEKLKAAQPNLAEADQKIQQLRRLMGEEEPPKPAEAAPTPAAEVKKPAAGPAPAAATGPVAASPAEHSSFLRGDLMRLISAGGRATRNFLWEKALGHYLVAQAAHHGADTPKAFPADLDDLVEIYMETADRLRGSGFYAQAGGLLYEILLHDPEHPDVEAALGTLVGEWRDYLIDQERHQQAIAMLEGHAEFGFDFSQELEESVEEWADYCRRSGDAAAAEALGQYLSARKAQWDKLRQSWASKKSAQPQKTEVDLGEVGIEPKPESAPEPAKTPEPEPAAREPATVAPEEPPEQETPEPTEPPAAPEPEEPKAEEPEVQEEPAPEPAPEPVVEPAAEPEPEPEPEPAAEQSVRTQSPGGEPAPAVAEKAPEASVDGLSQDDLAAALVADPESVESYEATVASFGDDGKAMIKFFRDLVSKNKDEPLHIRNLARAYVATEQATLAVIQFQKYLKKAPSAEGYEELAQTYESIGKDDLARLMRKKGSKL